MVNERVLFLYVVGILLAGYMVSNPVVDISMGKGDFITGYVISNVSSSCDEDHTIFKISGGSNAHASVFNQSSYNVKICAEEIGSRNCDGSNIVARLSADENAHVASPKISFQGHLGSGEFNPPGYKNICYGDFACEAVSNSCDSLGNEYECVYSISNTLNAHAGDCDAYPLKVCCKLDVFVAPPTVECNDGLDNDGDGSIDLQDTGCFDVNDNDENDVDNFEDDDCSFTVLNDRCGEVGCDTDSDGDGAFTNLVNKIIFVDREEVFVLKTQFEDREVKFVDVDLANLVIAIAEKIPLGEETGFVNRQFSGLTGDLIIVGEDFPYEYIQSTDKLKVDTKELITTKGCDSYPDSACGITTEIDNCGGQGCDADTDGDGTADQCQGGPLCELLSAEWSKADAKEGDEISLIVKTTNTCDGREVNFAIFEKDTASADDPVQVNPPNSVVSAGEARAIWVAEYDKDQFSIDPDPEYYFQASLGAQSIQSNELQVEQGTNLCGNGVVDDGEDCFSCGKDAGCLEGNVCCPQEDGTVVCATSCSGDADDGDNVCDDGENCGVEACQEKDNVLAGCLEGLICSDEGLCDCNSEKDNICTKDSSCQFLDPDCDKDGDGKNDIAGDNCPNIKNQDQFDSDSDSANCAYDTEGKGLHFNPITQSYCGGDECDIDDDNDGVCDADARINGNFCTGTDLCGDTPQGTVVDENGCSAEQEQCVTSWDCTNVQWSECDLVTKTRTRDIGQCDSVQDVRINNLCRCIVTLPDNDACWSISYRPNTVESCEPENEEAEFPFFDLGSLFMAILLLLIYYIYRRKFVTV